ncbi:cobalamin adenosyltransferase [[Clostridium] colinum]|uniref:cobalamin adenosyltransferase n=1 Tax=[Clostridium] colinum TaxID=36835 RepID=UPI002023CD01|nr:cobalamin adenosyltransferase [[Clostridium] colinum]
MALITENILKELLKDEKVENVILKKTDIITPLAKEFIEKNKIKITYEDTKVIKNPENVDFKEQKNIVFKEKIANKDTENEYKYKFITSFGAKLDYKPEHMTHLRGSLLVFKDHKQIIFRGKMDSLEAKILETQIFCKNKNKLVDDLQEILIFVRNITKAEVLDTKLEEIKLLGLNEQQIRDMSHNPKKYFNIGHEFPDYRMGDLAIYINSIRTLVREVELSAYQAFKDEYGNVSREDIIKALNRLSSVCWIIMFKIRLGQYD